MSKTAYLIPRAGLTVLQPRGGKYQVPTPLPPEGASVELTTYWRRRLIDGDVTVAEPAEPAAPAAKTKAKTTTDTDSAGT